MVPLSSFSLSFFLSFCLSVFLSFCLSVFLSFFHRSCSVRFCGGRSTDRGLSSGFWVLGSGFWVGGCIIDHTDIQRPPIHPSTHPPPSLRHSSCVRMTVAMRQASSAAVASLAASRPPPRPTRPAPGSPPPTRRVNTVYRVLRRASRWTPAAWTSSKACGAPTVLMPGVMVRGGAHKRPTSNVPQLTFLLSLSPFFRSLSLSLSFLSLRVLSRSFSLFLCIFCLTFCLSFFSLAFSMLALAPYHPQYLF